MNAFLLLALALAALAILAGGWLGWQLLRQNGRQLLRLEALEQRLNELEFGEPDAPAGLPIGSVAPEFNLPDLKGETRTLAQFLGQPLLLIFFNPACGYCRDLAPKLAALSSRSRQGNEADSAYPKSEMQKPNSDDRLLTSAATENLPQLIILTTGDAGKPRQFFAAHKLECPVILQKEMEVATAYQANGTPSGYLISPEGKIASELAIGADALLALAAEPRSSRRGEAPDPKSEVRSRKPEVRRRSEPRYLGCYEPLRQSLPDAQQDQARWVKSWHARAGFPSAATRWTRRTFVGGISWSPGVVGFLQPALRPVQHAHTGVGEVSSEAMWY